MVYIPKASDLKASRAARLRLQNRRAEQELLFSTEADRVLADLREKGAMPSEVERAEQRNKALLETAPGLAPRRVEGLIPDTQRSTKGHEGSALVGERERGRLDGLLKEL